MVVKYDLERLTDTEAGLLKNFQEQIDTLFRHERYVFRLVRRLKRLRNMIVGGNEKDISSAFNEIENIIKALKSEVLQKFDILKPKEGNIAEAEQIIDYERKKNQAMIDIKAFLQNAYNQVLEKESELKQKETIAGKKMRRALHRLREEIEEEGRGLKINEQVFLLIEKLHEFKESLYHLIAYEYQLLDDIVTTFKSSQPKAEKAEKFEDTERKLRVLIASIKSHLRTEKAEVYKPLMEVIGKELSGAETFYKLQERKDGKLISLEDVKSDIYTMTDTTEIFEYISALKANKELIEESAWPHIQKYYILAKEIMDKVKKESILDPLTGLFTRRLMWAQLDNLTFSNIKKPDSFSIILIDIDHFKNINDTLGHQAGDAVLAKMARLIRSRLRSSDIACRYGGEEFVVILPRIKAADAYAKAEEIRKAVESYEFELKDRRHLTISAGVASYDGKVTKEDLIRFADEKLYRAKATGRNKVIL